MGFCKVSTDWDKPYSYSGPQVYKFKWMKFSHGNFYIKEVPYIEFDQKFAKNSKDTHKYINFIHSLK